MISPKVWRALTDLNEDAAIATYTRAHTEAPEEGIGQAGRGAHGRPEGWQAHRDGRVGVCSRDSTRRRPEAATAGRATQSSIASGYRSRRRWATRGVWVLMFAVSACLWVVSVQVVRFIAGLL